jgi:hypothetical protein
MIRITSTTTPQAIEISSQDMLAKPPFTVWKIGSRSGFYSAAV